MNTSKNKILAITGATGKRSGGAFFEVLTNNINDVKKEFTSIRCVTREKSNTQSLLDKINDLEIYKGDFDDIDFLTKAFNNVDTLIHIAGTVLSKNIVDAASNANVRRLILVHTSAIYSKYRNAGANYKEIDKYCYKVCKENNIILTILRPTMIYGNIYDKNVITFVKMVDKLPIMPVVNGAKYRLQPVYYKDLGKAYYSVLMNESKTANKDFILSGKEPILLRDMLIIIANNLNKKIKFISIPFFIAYIGAWIIFILTLGKKDYREKVQRLCEERVFPHDEATNILKYNPISFDEGVKIEIEQYKNKV